MDSTQWRNNRGDAHSTFYTVAQLAPSDLFTNTAAGDLSVKEDARQKVAGKGMGGTGITTDYTGETRSTTAPAAGAYEYLPAGLPDTAPVITSHNGAATVTLDVMENQKTVTTVTAADDNPGSGLVYSILNNDDGSYFTINSATGELSFITAPDFERPSDPDENNLYIVTVQVSDGTFTDAQRFKVRITNVNDNAPEFGSYSGDAAVTLKIPENTTAVGTVWAIDKEPGTIITYSIVPGQDGARFTVDPVTGVVKFITAPDFENPTDEYASNVYIVTIQASDGQLASCQRFKVKVTDVNDGAGRMSSRSVLADELFGEAEAGKGIAAYPNPVTGKRFTLRMDSKAAGRYMIELYSLSGQLVYSRHLDHASVPATYPVQLPVTIMSGTYVLRVRSAAILLTEKIIVQ